MSVDLFFYTESPYATELLADELNTWTYWSVTARATSSYCVTATAEAEIIDEDDRLDAIAERYGGTYDGYGRNMV